MLRSLEIPYPDRFFILSGIKGKRVIKPDRMKNLSGRMRI